MNPESAILSLIAELKMQIAGLQQEVERLRRTPASAPETAKAEAKKK